METALSAPRPTFREWCTSVSLAMSWTATVTEYAKQMATGLAVSQRVSVSHE